MLTHCVYMVVLSDMVHVVALGTYTYLKYLTIDSAWTSTNDKRRCLHTACVHSSVEKLITALRYSLICSSHRADIIYLPTTY